MDVAPRRVAEGSPASLWVLLRRPLAKRKIRAETPSARQMWNEFGYSMLTVTIFGSVGTGMALGIRPPRGAHS